MKKIILPLLFFFQSVLIIAQQDSIALRLTRLKDNVQKINYLIKISYQLMSEGSGSRGVMYARKATQLAEENHILLTNAYYSLGDILFKNKEYNGALPFLEESLRLAQQSKDKSLEAKSLLQLARILLLEGKNVIIGLQYTKKAALLASDLSDNVLLADILLVMGDEYKFQGDYKKALECHLQALKFKEKEGALLGVSDALHSLGWTYASISEFDKALEYHNRNIEIRNQTGDIQGLGETFIAIGRCYQGKLEFAKALNYYFEALTVFESSDFKAKSQNRNYWIGIVKNDIGWCYNLWNKPEKALPFLLSSMELREKDGNEQMLTYIYHTLGETYLELKRYDEAEKYLLLTLRLTEKLGLRNDRMMAYDNLSKLEIKKKNFERVVHFKEKYNALKDSLFNENKQKEIAYVQAAFEIEKKESENKILQEQLNLQKALVEKQIWIIVAVAGGLLSFIVMSFYLYRNNRQRKITNEILQEQKEEIAAQNEEIANQNNEILNKNEELHQLIDELHQLNDYLDDLVRERTQLLERQNQQLREYAFINAHKLRAPLASILGLVNIIKMSDYQDIDKTIIDHLRFSTEKLDMVIHEIQQTVEEVKVPDLQIVRLDSTEDTTFLEHSK